ncbi:uncharacterized protein BT62DRAFT_465681 [Guyanagaster necrorhizus]|uniref:DUF6699 domain-containing protein n=1 Tax=Guyanagaster necrorhizus TaxID=856835 RepID=A0A9P8ANE9_9AGAR|nr:uncharacterized protein BT62DRAFT_465681 [Guyanagaster necrorhizus MCA 3950]KAG7441830.1 hypothetical protein BT62DRAFT_465681 [Guyanagaster necrorhizus MCA 3950]
MIEYATFFWICPFGKVRPSGPGRGTAIRVKSIRVKLVLYKTWIQWVRFALDQTYKVPPTPSPAKTSSTLPSSRGSSSRQESRLPGPTPYSPYSLPRPKVRVHHPQVHSLLRVAKPPAINYDLAHHPSTITTDYSTLSSRPNFLHEPALSPPVSQLTLTSPHLLWCIRVHPSLNGAYVTVADVLHAMYSGLRENIAPAEFYGLPSQTEMRRVTDAYEQRYRRIKSRSGSYEEKKAGVKRIDFFMGRTRFAGLSPSSKGPDVWAMNIL